MRSLRGDSSKLVRLGTLRAQRSQRGMHMPGRESQSKWLVQVVQFLVQLVQHGDANVDAPRRVGCIRARVGRRRVDPWLLAWHLLLALCGLRSMCVPISRWDLRRGQIPNGHGKAPIDPVVVGSQFKMRHTEPRQADLPFRAPRHRRVHRE
jgi:hypothetical protein